MEAQRSNAAASDSNSYHLPTVHLLVMVWDLAGGLIDSNYGRKLSLTISTALAPFSPRQAKCHMLQA
jgi:hypothetical protein